MEKNKLELRTKEVQNIIYTYAPAEEGFQKTIFTAMNYSFQAGGKETTSVINAGNLPFIWRNRKSCRAVYGSNRDDTYLFPDP